MLARVGVEHIPVRVHNLKVLTHETLFFYYRFNSYTKLVTGYGTEVSRKKIRFIVFSQNASVIR